MAIISSTVAQTTLNGDGSIAVREEHTFHNDVKRPWRYDALDGADHSLLLPSHAVKIEAREKARELGNFARWLADNRNPANFDRQHNTAGALIKPLIKGFMSVEDPVRALKMARWIRDNLSDAQLDGRVPVAVRQKVQSRIINLMSMEAALEADASHIVKVPE